MDKKEIAAVLESLCERPFAGEQEGLAIDASRFAQALANPEAKRSSSPSDQADSGQAEDSGPVTAALASILSGTAAPAQCHGFQAAAVTSGATRLEAQSALAFVDGIAQAPLAAPAHLVEQVLASAGGARAKPGIWFGLWSRLCGNLLGRRRGQVAAACAVMLVAGGLSWSLLRRPADLAPANSVVPVAASPQAARPISGIGSPPASAPVFAPAPAAPAPPPRQALADPCAPRNFAKSEAAAASEIEPRAAKPAPNPLSKSAAVPAPDPGCAVDVGASETGRNPQADQGAVRTDRPAARIGRSDRDQAAAAASAPAAAPYPGAAPPALPAMRPGTVQQPR